MTQTLKKKTEKFEKELEKVRTQKAQLVDKEKNWSKTSMKPRQNIL